MAAAAVQNDQNPWPGSQLKAGVDFYWSSPSEGGRALFHGRFECYGKTTVTAAGTDHFTGTFTGVEVSIDYGRSWQPIDSQTFSTRNTFYTSKEALLRSII